MKKKNRFILYFLLFPLLPVLSLWTGASLYKHSFAAGAQGNLVIAGSEAGLQIEHSDNPFTFENLYPGCSAAEKATSVRISNCGNSDFDLLIDKKMLSCDQGGLALYGYDGLQMEVVEQGLDKTCLWYSGPLKKLERIEVGAVAPGEEAREFLFLLSLDQAADNSLQGQQFVLEWTFSAGGGEEIVVPPDDPKIMPEDDPVTPRNKQSPFLALPQTWAFASPSFWAVGLALAAAGLFLGRRALPERKKR